MSERYEFIDAEKGTRTGAGERKYTITKMCEWLEVSTSGYYEWRDRPESDTAKRRAYLALMVRKVFEDSDETYTVIGGSTPSWPGGARPAAPSWSAASCVRWTWSRASPGRGGTT